MAERFKCWKEVLYRLRQYTRKGSKRSRRRRARRVIQFIRFCADRGVTHPNQISRKLAWKWYSQKVRYGGHHHYPSQSLLKERYYALRWLFSEIGKGTPPDPRNAHIRLPVRRRRAG